MVKNVVFPPTAWNALTTLAADFSASVVLLNSGFIHAPLENDG